MAPFISLVGNTPFLTLFCALNNRLIPLRLIKNIPIIAVKKIIDIVLKTPIFDPTFINIVISIIGIIINKRNINLDPKFSFFNLFLIII